jgi:hypothetical protein
MGADGVGMGAGKVPGEGAGRFLPQGVTGLFPGSLAMSPMTISLTAQGMLQLVERSLMPPMRPGHLSIPLSPASQLSMICWSVGTSQPAS